MQMKVNYVICVKIWIKEFLFKKQFEIINLNILSNIFISFNKLISIFSYKKCFNVELNTIIYTNYSEVEFDYDKINIENGKFLLSKKFKKCTTKKEQIYIIYRFKTFTGENIIIVMIIKLNMIIYFMEIILLMLILELLLRLKLKMDWCSIYDIRKIFQ